MQCPNEGVRAVPGSGGDRRPFSRVVSNAQAWNCIRGHEKTAPKGRLE